MIRVLDSFIADKIAAGEVIERPVSAVKELVENSIDAGAESIIVEIRNGGKSYIRVTDDGCGIPAEEAETAFLRHATSKISSISDLDNINSLGFRGEALASIAAVSKLTLVTRPALSTAGTRLMMHGGRVISNETAGANPGTTIVVEDIFYNTPARRKFMKSDAREASAIIDLIEQYAICYSDIRFMMINSGSTVFSTAGDGDTLSAIKSLYPDKEHSDLLHVGSESDGVRGFISDPGTTKNTRRGQLFFVNGRLVSSPVIEKGIEKGYGGRIFSGYPIAVLFIEADPHELDVNIHPGKREIRFLHRDQIIERISAAIDQSLRSEESVPVMQEYVSAFKENKADQSSDASGASWPEYQLKSGSDADAISFAGEQSSIREYLSSLRREPASPDRETVSSSKSSIELHKEITDTAADDKVDIHVSEKTEESLEPENIQDLPGSEKNPEGSGHYRPFDFDDLTYCGYVFDTYIIMQARDEMYLFDQHAAHERIFYEKLTSEFLKKNQLPQPILTPVTLSVSADVYYKERDWLDTLTDMGYDIDDFGSCTFMIRGIPAYMTMSEAVGFAKSFCEEVEDADVKNKVVIDKLIMRSCKSAVKGGDSLSQMEIRDLIASLSECSDPFACPHGRPTFIRISKYEIEKSFRRIV